MPTTQRVKDFVSYVEQVRIVEALEKFYDEDVVMQDNAGPPVVGRAANLERERAFFGAITVHQMRALSVVVDGDRVTINWLFEYTSKDGRRYRMDQLAYQTWRGDRIVRERFYYDSASILAA